LVQPISGGERGFAKRAVEIVAGELDASPTKLSDQALTITEIIRQDDSRTESDPGHASASRLVTANTKLTGSTYPTPC
tara:strand:- start:4238 stop:4471 length:234 start_codon:yes stop_codon:yes gene_type:complete